MYENTLLRKKGSQCSRQNALFGFEDTKEQWHRIDAKMMENIRYKILIIEDDKLDQMAFTRMVKEKELSYDYTVAGSVSQAKNILASQSFDAVVSDYSLSDGTALDVLDAVKNTPVILVTGAGDEKVALNAWKAGAYDYLVKDHERHYLKTLPITIENAIEHGKLREILDRKQKSLEAIFDAVPVGMMLVDQDLVVKRVNNAVRQMSGKDYSQLIEQKLGTTLNCVNSRYDQSGCGHSQACLTCQLRNTAQSAMDSQKGIRDVEFRGTFKIYDRQDLAWVLVGVEPITINGRKHVVLSIDDITEKKQAEEKVKEAMQLKSQFISTVSHELRTPLAAMKEGIAIVLEGIAGQLNEKQRKFLDIAKRNADRLGNLINNVLDFSKLESGRMDLDIQNNDIKEVVSEVHETMALSAKKKRMKLLLEFAEDLPTAKFDRDKIIQVLTNLVSNAIKFTPEKGWVSVNVRHDNEELVISVSDNGMGIPKEAFLKIFERFYCINRPGKEIQGTGLGLSIVKRILMMHGGRIEVESEVNKGTTFTVFLPLAGEPISGILPAKMDKLLENSLVQNESHLK